ncbi:histidine phosphatase family protein [Schaalia sp. 19OD2882]|uniref:SixA phosphatase family protein n=1 Tax=Schaalia sp. 19OD2882 TaxID=2794089 RepID=UPI001C1EB599|nr:histidine phosphatase family protein [Schaalia sp. 19OD2882]QWW20465.1 histidine phosphatase family protein [Schaalia sp. 19OD2882]
MTRRTLVVVRHAHAVGHSHGGDHARALSPAGRDQAAGLGLRLAAELPVVDQAAVSDAVRAVQTYEGLTRTLRVRRGWADRELYDAGPRHVLRLARAFEGEVAMVVGHEPTISGVGRLLARDEDVDLVRGGVGTATALLLDFDGAWQDLAPGMCSLRVIHEERR